MCTRRLAIALMTVISLLNLTACTLRPDETPPAPSTKNDLAAAKDNINLALDYLQTQDTADAKNKLMLALSEEPDYPATWYTMGYYEEATKHIKQAEHDYKRAIALTPRSGIAHNNYGTFLCRHGRYKEAIDQFIVAANDPTYVHVGGAYENAGICAMEIPDEQAAKGFFIQALNNGPLHKTSLYELARIYYKESNPILSKSYFERYAKLTNTPQSKYQALMTQHELLHRS